MIKEQASESLHAKTFEHVVLWYLLKGLHNYLLQSGQNVFRKKTTQNWKWIVKPEENKNELNYSPELCKINCYTDTVETGKISQSLPSLQWASSSRFVSEFSF